MSNYSYQKIKQFITEQTGIVYYQDKDKDLSLKIEKRMQAAKVSDYESYWKLLTENKTGRTEFDRLVNTLTIGETYFFRDKNVFNGLKEFVIPKIVQRNSNNRTLRIWSAGCASGEETYSLSILLKQELAGLLSGWDITILGTDINRDSIAQAYEGRYGEWSFRETSDEIKKACFVHHGRTWQLKSKYKQGTHFEYHNLVKNPFPSLVHNLVAFDIILNRNVIIYFDESTIIRLIDQFERSLVDGGWLIVGHADHNMKYFTQFKGISVPGAFFYQKITPSEQPERMDFSNNQHNPLFSPIFKTTTPSTPQKKPDSLPIVPEPVNKSAIKSPSIPSITRDMNKIETDIGRLCLLANQGEWNQALDFASQLMKKDNLNPDIYFLQALVHEQTGQILEAETLLRKALYLDRKAVPIHYHLGLLLQKKHNLKSAKKSFENTRTLLEGYEPGYKFELADNITAAQLKELTEFNLEVLENYDNRE